MTKDQEHDRQHTNDTQIRETVPARSRRRVLGLLAAAAAVKSLPETWMRPVVQSVVLPAHAQTSPGDEEESPFSIECELTMTTTFEGFITLIMLGTVSGPGTAGEGRLRIDWQISDPELTNVSSDVDIEPDGSFVGNINFPDGGQTEGEATVSFMDTDTFGDVSCTDNAALPEED